MGIAPDDSFISDKASSISIWAIGPTARERLGFQGIQESVVEAGDVFSNRFDEIDRRKLCEGGRQYVVGHAQFATDLHQFFGLVDSNEQTDHVGIQADFLAVQSGDLAIAVIQLNLW